MINHQQRELKPIFVRCPVLSYSENNIDSDYHSVTIKFI